MVKATNIACVIILQLQFLEMRAAMQLKIIYVADTIVSQMQDF